MNPWTLVLSAAGGLAAGLAIGTILAVAYARRAERRARRSERRAREAEHLAYVGTMTGGLAHEIRNPLSTLNLNAQLLEEDLDRPGHPADPRVMRKLRTIQEEARELEETLDAFLEFAGKMDLHPEPVDVADFLDNLVAFYQDRMERSNVRLRIRTRDGLPPIAIDRPKMRQAVSNLLLNAEHAMADGGELMIAAEPTGEGVCIQVTDTGPGIEPEALDKIFQPYYSTREGGTGLGLPTVRRIVQEHGGSVEVHSEPGRGTRFSLFLPAAEPDETEQTDG